MHQTLAIANAVEILWRTGGHVHLDTIERCVREKTLGPDFRFPDTDARLSLGRLCALSARWKEAQSWFAKARAVLEEQGARPLRAITDLDEAWAMLRRDACGDRARALVLLEAAAEQFEAIGMPGWVRCAERLANGQDGTTGGPRLGRDPGGEGSRAL